MSRSLDSPPVSTIQRVLFVLTILFGAISIPVGGWMLYDYSLISKGSGSYLLRVEVSSARSIRAVRCYPASSQTDAQVVVDHVDDEWKLLPRNGRAEPFTGAPIEVDIYTWCNTTRSGREISGGHLEWLAVCTEFDDGTRVGKLAEIPDMRIAREVRVEFP
jgi:hypothetical protein